VAKLSEAQAKKLAELEALRDAQDDEPPEQVAFEIEGVTVWLPYKQAKTFLKRNGVDLDEVLEEAGEEGKGEEGEEGEEEEEPEGEEEEGEALESGVPRIPRKRPAKKLTPPGPEPTRSQRYFRKSS